MLNIQRLRHIGIGVPDTLDVVRFYEDTWGLRIVDDHNGAVYLRGTGKEHHILALYPAPRRGINHISFALDGAAAVDAAASELADQGVQILEQPRNSEEPGGGYGLRFVDPDGRIVELSADVDEHQPDAGDTSVRPTKVTHVVLNTADIDGLCDFYARVLGFRISDWSEHQMVFLRCNPDHHSIAFNQAPHASLNHVAYELPSMEDVMRGIGKVRQHGPQQMWGPGRHGPGNNVFAYFQDAGGFVCEYTSDVQQIVDEARWVPQVWQRTPELMDRWGTAGSPPPEMRTAMTGEPDPALAEVPEAQVQGLHLHFDLAGAESAPALILLHGIGSNRRSFRRQLEGLADTYRVIALDAPGYGCSGDPPGMFTLELVADAAAGLLNQLGIGAAHVLGHSMGGVAAQLLYHRHSGLVLSLLLADTNPGSGALPEPERSARIERRIRAVETQTPRQIAETRAPALVSASASSELVDELIEVMAELRPTTYRAAAIAMGATDLSELLASIRVPTLVLVGEMDTTTPPEVAAALAQSIPGAQLVMIRGAGHASNQERPDQFNAAVRRFLDSLHVAE